MGLAVGAGVVLLVVAGLSGSLDYYRDVDSLLSAPDLQPGVAVRVKGTVVAESVSHEMATGVTRFELAGERHSIPVLFPGDPPPLFGPGREVVVTGYLRRGGLFEAHEVLTKCPSKYEARRKPRS